jgi:hypothetical protein
MDELTPTKIRYIKLGAGGAWEAALDRGRLEWGTGADAHVAAQGGDWDAVAAVYAERGLARSTVTSYTNEARAFFDGDPTVLWITFARGRMWWTFAGAEVHSAGRDEAEKGAYHREALGGWRDRDRTGAVLDFDRLSTRLTQLAGYRRTMCTLSPEQGQLCLRYIHAGADEVQNAVKQARAVLRQHLTTLVQRLAWRDFEQLIDLALSRLGWLRVSGLGGTTKDLDLLVEQPFTGERMSVQVKSRVTQQVVDDYARRLGERPTSGRNMLICHSPDGVLRPPLHASAPDLKLLVGAKVTDLALNAGLVDWIVERAR